MSAPAALEPGSLSVTDDPASSDAAALLRAASQLSAPPRSGGGRHARQEPVGRRERRTTPDLPLEALVLEDLPLPDGEATPEQVEAIADQMLLRLAVSEPKQRFLDPDEVPGGKWVLAGLGTVLVISLLMLVYTVLGYFLGG